MSISSRRLLHPALAALCALGSSAISASPPAAPEDPSTGSGPGEPRILAANLKTHVEFLAADALRGRNDGSEGNAQAVKYLREWMETFGLEPGGPDGGWLQPFEESILGHPVKGANLIGRLAGSDPELAKEAVIVSAHHDHLGDRYGRIYNGADDDASGCALVLELARVLAGRKEKPKRTVYFVTFDAEEDGLVGSRHFVQSGLVPIRSMAAMLGFDIVGGDFYPGCENRLFLLGGEHSAELAERAERSGEGDGLEVRRFGVSLIEPFGRVFPRSDYGAFRDAEVPFLFFSTGTPWYYHTEYDDPERLNYAKMEKIARYVLKILAGLADGGARPAFAGGPEPRIEDVRGVLEACRDLLERRAALGFSAEALDRLQRHAAELREMRDEGPYDTARQRRVQTILVDLFTIISQAKLKGESDK